MHVLTIDQWREALEAETAPGSIQVWFAAHGSDSEQRSLATASNITVDAALLLLTNGQKEIVETLCLNRAVLPEFLALAYAERPDLRSVIALNPAAPVHVKMPLPLIDLSGAGINRFLQAVSASPEESDALFAFHAREDPRLTLGHAWMAIRSPDRAVGDSVL